MEFVFGCDPELFVKSGDEFVSGYGLIPGSKSAPHKVENGAIQVDGMALEVNINPAADEQTFIGNLNSVLEQLRALVPDFQVVPVPVAQFSDKTFQEAPDEAKELGCDPDFNAWEGGAINPKPDGDVTFRTGAGHIHIGWTEGVDITNPEHLDACMMVVKQMDCLLGCASVLFDDDTKRRELYGKAGAFRPKHYGVEYRTLSNAWLQTPELQSLIFRMAEAAVNDLFDGIRYYEINDSSDEVVNDSNTFLAEYYLDSLSYSSHRVKSLHSDIEKYFGE